MQSSFYKARFAAEYLQLSIRLQKLKHMCYLWDKGELTFEPTCPRTLYDKQIASMESYLDILKERARLESVKLSEYEEDTHNFAWAMQHLLEGEKIALPEWAGYWYLGEDARIYLFTKDGQTLDTPDYAKYASRTDWKIYDTFNELQLKEYQETFLKNNGSDSK